MAQDVVAAPPPPPAAAKPPAPPASPHPGDRDVEGHAAAAVDQLLESLERVLADVVGGRLPGVGFENDAASTSLEDLIKTLNTADISADEGRTFKENLRMWEGGKLFLRAGKPSDDEAAAARDRVELRRDVFVAVVDAIKDYVDEKHGSIGSHGVSFGDESDWVIRL